MPNEEKKRQGERPFRYAVVAFCAIAVFLTYSNNLPRWLYFEHFILLVHTLFPAETEYVFHLAVFPFNVVYFVVRYMRTYREHKRVIDREKKN